jgi:hypothetical protein
MCNDGSAGGGNSYCKMYSWTSVFIWEFFITAQYVGFQTCFTLILRIFHKVLFHFVSNVAQHETLFCIFLSFRKLLDVKWTSILCLDFFWNKWEEVELEHHGPARRAHGPARRAHGPPRGRAPWLHFPRSSRQQTHIDLKPSMYIYAWYHRVARGDRETDKHRNKVIPPKIGEGNAVGVSTCCSSASINIITIATIMIMSSPTLGHGFVKVTCIVSLYLLH